MATNLTSTSPPLFNQRPSFLRHAKHLTFRIQCSTDFVQDTSNDDTAVGTARRSSSLISAANVQKALRGLAITDVDHYGRLGIVRGCPYEQVKVAYEMKCEELMNQGLDEEKVSNKLEMLKESYEILSSEEDRRLYDWSLARSEKPDRYMWPFEVDITQTPTEPAPPQEPEDVGPTRLVGYFFLAWFILSVVVSITVSKLSSQI